MARLAGRATGGWHGEEECSKRGEEQGGARGERRVRPARLRCALSVFVLSCIVAPGVPTVGASIFGSTALALFKQQMPTMKAKDKAVIVTQLREEVAVLEKQLTLLERTLALLQSRIPPKTLQANAKDSIKHPESEVQLPASHLNCEVSKQKLVDDDFKVPAWVEALGVSDVSSGTKAKSGEELDPSLIDSEWIEGPSPVPSPPSEHQTVGFREGNMLSDINAEVDMSSVTPRGMSPSADYGRTDTKRGYDDGFQLAEEVSRITSMGRTDMPLRIQRTQSMFDIVIPDEELEPRVKKPVDELVFFLDIDKCAIYGQDGNDLPIAMQWMGRSGEALRGLYSRLVNPQLRPLYQQLSMSVESLPVVLYTMRPQLLRYRSAVRGHRFALKWNPAWHHTPDQIAIPSEIKDASEILSEYTGTPLYPQETQDLTMSFQRLLAIRDVIQGELGLSAPPTIVVSATVKDVQATATRLGLSAARSYLWDDNEVLCGQPHVLTVEPYVAMPPAQRDQTLAYLQQNLPASELTEEVVDFMLGAQPDIRSVEIDPAGGRRYALRDCPAVGRFPIPDLPLHYPTPRYTVSLPEMGRLGGHGPAKRGPVAAGGGGLYCGSLAEYYSLAWRKGDPAAAAAEGAAAGRMTWKESMEMVW